VLAENALAALPAGAAPASLEELGVPNNALQRLAPFGALPRLCYLDASSNALRRVDGAAFRGCPALVRIDAGCNNLAGLEPGTFAGLGALQELDMPANALAALPAGLFDGLRNLTTLYLNDNKLRSLPPRLFADLPAASVGLYDNPLPPACLCVWGDGPAARRRPDRCPP